MKYDNLHHVAAIFGAMLVGSALTASLSPGARQSSDLPNPHLTPGAVLTTDVEVIRPANYSKSVRNVSESEKHEVAARYGLSVSALKGCEVDHLCPLSLGGSNDITNLWPQSYSGRWNARVKDRLEVHVLTLVRDGELDLPEMQQRITSNWIELYRELFGSEPVEHRSDDHEQ